LLRSIRKDNEDTNGVIHLLTRWGIIQRDLIPIIQTYSKDTLLLCMAGAFPCMPVVSNRKISSFDGLHDKANQHFQKGSCWSYQGLKVFFFPHRLSLFAL